MNAALFFLCSLWCNLYLSCAASGRAAQRLPLSRSKLCRNLARSTVFNTVCDDPRSSAAPLLHPRPSLRAASIRNRLKWHRSRHDGNCSTSPREWTQFRQGARHLGCSQLSKLRCQVLERVAMNCGTLLGARRWTVSVALPSPRSVAPRRIVPCKQRRSQPEASPSVRIQINSTGRL